MGHWHARAIEAAGGVVAAVVDVDLERARSLANGAAAVRSLAELGSVDVVHICSPVESHPAAVRAAIERDAHAVVEKPLAEDAATTASLLEEARAAGRALVPVHQFLFQPGVQGILRRRGELGSLVRCAFVAASAGSETTGMGADELVAEVLPHPLSLFVRLTPLDVGKLEWQVTRPASGELRALAVAGTTSLEIVVTAHARPTSAMLEVMGTEATAVADLFHGFAMVESGRPTRAVKLARPFTRSTRTLVGASLNLAARAAARETAYPGLRELVRRTYAALVTGEQLPVPAHETISVAEARDRILGRRGTGA